MFKNLYNFNGKFCLYYRINFFKKRDLIFVKFYYILVINEFIKEK